MSKALDPIMVSMLISQGLQVWATMSERLASGAITDEDIAKMLALLDTELDAWQAKIDAHRA
jgi:hypothetical protein